MSFLMFDFEHGHQSLGSKDKVKEMLGMPVLMPSSWNEFQNTISKIYTSQQVKKEVQLSEGLTIEEECTEIVPRN